MDSIFICNTGEDSISKINLESQKVVTIPLRLEEKPIGPRQGFISTREILITNNYSNSIISIHKETLKELYKLNVGAFPNDIEILKDKIYVACSDSNAIQVYDLKELQLEYSIKCNWPVSMAVLREKELLVVANLGDDTISFIDININRVVKALNKFKDPCKVKISKDEEFIYLCESNVSNELPGYFTQIRTKDFKVENRIKVGMVPTDFCENNDVIFVSNSVDGTVSVISKSNFKEIRKIKVGGIISSLLMNKDKLIVTDVLNNKVNIIDIITGNVKVIATGKEPIAMTKYTIE